MSGDILPWCSGLLVFKYGGHTRHAGAEILWRVQTCALMQHYFLSLHYCIHHFIQILLTNYLQVLKTSLLVVRKMLLDWMFLY